MELHKYHGEYVRIIDVDNCLWEGQAELYIDAYYDEPDDIDAIVIRCEKGKLVGNLVEFTEPEIKSIEIIDRPKD
jgi:hypothetical protein